MSSPMDSTVQDATSSLSSEVEPPGELREREREKGDRRETLVVPTLTCELTL